MMKLSQSLLNKPVMSLRTGRAVAAVTHPIINPDNLKIEGFYCIDSMDRTELVLLYQDIRDVLPQGFVIDDHDVLAKPDDLVRLKKLIDQGFDVMGKQVVTVGKQKLGKVTDYATEVETMYIHKLYVSQGIMKSFAGGNLGVDRSQITEISDTRITVLDPLEGGAVRAGAPA